MRAVASESETSKLRPVARPARLRKSRLRNLALEALEARQLLSTLPPALTTGRTALAGGDAPSIAVDPNDPTKLVAVYFNGTGIGAAYSTDSGANWTPLSGSFANGVSDPSAPANPLPLTTDASVAFDAHDNFYVVDSPRKTDFSAGRVALEAFRFDTATPVQRVFNNFIDSWVTAPTAFFKPSLAVDANQTTNNGVTDPGADMVAGTAPNQIHVGAVFVTVSAGAGGAVLVQASKDGGSTFYATKVLGGGVSPRAVVSQGRGADPAAFGAGDQGVQGGQVAVVWDINNQSGLPSFVPSIPDGIATGTVQYGPYAPGAGAVLNTPISEATPGTTATTSVPVTVNLPDFNFTLAKLTATVALTHGDLSEVSIVLQPPSGSGLPSVTLLKNKVDASGNPVVPAQGDTGQNLGIDAGGNPVGTTFDDKAATSIDAAPIGPGNAGNSYIPEQAGGLTALNGATTGQVNGVWHLVVTDFRSDASFAAQVVKSFSLSLLDTSGLRLTQPRFLASTFVYGSPDGIKPYPNFSPTNTPVLPTTGFGPSPVIASDNTLGTFSPHSGRLYVSYVDRNNIPGNPFDHTGISLLFSDDGGQTWQSQGQVSDANGATDGFSEGGNPITGRPQIQPSLAVDPTTGTVVLSYLDARNDAARSRVATYIQTSIDGGQSWSQGAYANASKTAVDAITGKTVNLGPIPDNQGNGDPVPAPGVLGDRDAVFGFGDHQGLAVFGGKIYPIWTSNQNTGFGLQIVVGHTVTAAGPRIVSSTMGPVGEPGDTLNAARNSGGDNGPQASALLVTFDRAIDPNSFDGSNISFTYEDVNGVATPLGSLGATVSPVTTNANDPNQNGHFGYTTFKVSFNAQSRVGTYSYTIAPNGSKTLSSRVGYVTTAKGLTQSEGLDQSAGQGGPNSYSVPTSNDTLPLVVPGPHVIQTTVQNQKPGSLDNEVLNGTVSYIDVKFDRAMNLFDGSAVVRMMGPAGPIAGPFTVTQLDPQTFRVGGFPTQQLSGTYTLTLSSSITDTKGEPLDTNLNAGVYVLRGVNPYAALTSNTYNSSDTPVAITAGTVSGGTTRPSFSVSTINVPDDYVVQGATVKVDITYPNDPDLKITLVGPDGTVAPDGTITGTRTVLALNTGSAGGANFSGTIFDDSLGLPSIDIAPAPFFGKFNPHGSLAVSFVTGSYRSKGPWKLVVENDGTGTGTIGDWALTLQNRVQSARTGLGEPVADQASASFRIFTDAPNNPLSANTWTSVGPAPLINTSTNGIKSGMVGAVAVDPSDPSGNTVYVGGASGGVWKTTNFMTSSPTGPTWIPLTDFGPTSGINVGSIAVFPRGSDPTKSIVIVGTGNPNTGAKGIGFLRSMDGGASWQLMGGTNNQFAQNTTVTYKVAVDPRLNSNNQVIMYAALGGSAQTAGLWRSLDSGTTWSPMFTGNGNATDVTLDPVSGQGVAGGNLQTVYAAFPGAGVYSSPNQGQSWFKMLGTTGDPLIQQSETGNKVPVSPLGPAPTGTAGGRIVLAKPFPLTTTDPSNPTVTDQLYQGWLYALVTNAGGLDGLYMTKDYGQNWTKLHIAAQVNQFGVAPSNNETLADYDPFGGGGNYNVSLAIDPTNPNVVYIGGAGGSDLRPGLLRVDASTVYDPHNFVSLDNSRPDGGLLSSRTTGPVTLINPIFDTNTYLNEPPGSPFYIPKSYLNLIRDPQSIFAVNSTLKTQNVAQFNNTGAAVKVFTYGPSSGPLNNSNDIHQLVTFVDPLTGHARLIIGDDQGVFTGVDTNGKFTGGVGTDVTPLGSRNGNLAITQFFYGAVQPSVHNSTNGATRDVVFYGGANVVGIPSSGSGPNDVLNNGNIGLNGPGNPGWTGPDGSSYGVATDPTGSGTVYRFIPAGQAGTNFFQVNGVGRTFGLTTGPGDPQWFNVGPSFNNGETTFGNFAVNPVNGNQMIISSSNGVVYRTEDQGRNWFPITPLSGTGAFNSYAPAVAFGAPDPGAPAGIGNLDNFLYAGTLNGQVYMTRTGGGGAGNSWSNISYGLDGSTVQRIIPDPVRGSHDAFAVTLGGVDKVNFPGPVPVTSSPTQGDIPSGAGLTEVITVPQPTNERLSDLSVNLNITLPPQAPNNQPVGADSDLAATLTAPDGTVFTLFSGVGGTSNAGFINTTFNDNGAQAINAGPPNAPAPPFTGTYQIQNGVAMVHINASNTNGPLWQKNIEGNWKLKVTNDGRAVARLNSWSIDFSAQGGAYYTPDTTAATPIWLNITNDLFQKTTPTYGDATQPSQLLKALTTMQVDWRYDLPYFAPLPNADPAPAPHPLLYVAGDGGVFRSMDDGQNWTIFPATADQTAATAQQLQLVNGGYLPNARVSDLQVAEGNVDPQTGRATWQPGDPNIMVASTYGRGQFIIDLAPDVKQNSTPTAYDFMTIDPGSLFTKTNDGKQVTLSTSPTVDGYSEQSAFGYTVNISLTDLTDPANPKPVSLLGNTQTDGNGRFQVMLNNYFAGKPSGVYTFGVQATDQTGAKGNVALFTFVYEINPVPAPLSVNLDPSTDSGPLNTPPYNGDHYTNFNNASGNAPLFDITGIEPVAGVTVYLVRATEVGGVIGSYQVVNSVITTGTSGAVQIADTNGGNGAIPDTPLNNPIDTAPPQPNQYVYSAYQVDPLKLQGSNYAPGLGVIVDSTAPTPPSTVTLDPASDSGTSNSDGYTNFNNSKGNAPLFDVTSIEPHAAVELLRDYIDPKTGKPTGKPVVVNTLYNVTPTGPKNTVQIADINGNNTPIPDSPVGNPADTAPPGGFPYLYTAIQIDLAGNVSKPTPSFGNRGAIVLDGTDSDLHGDNLGTGGKNEFGWLYMQKVLEVIQPNITNGNKVLVALGTYDSGGALGTAGKAIDSAFQQSPLPGLGWTIRHVFGVANEDAFLSGRPATAVDSSDKPAGTVTLGQTGLLYITTANETFDDMTDADITMLNTHGVDIKNYLNNGGGLYTQTETPSNAPAVQNNPPGYGWLQSLFPGIQYHSEGSGGFFSTISLTAAGSSIFPTLTSADLSTGPWHGFFFGTIPPVLASIMTAPDENGVTQTLGLSTIGTVVTTGSQVIIDSTPPVVPALSLDAASDTGTYNNDDVTKDNNGNPNPAPVFDAGNVEPNAIVTLYRAAWNPATGTYGAPIAVNTLTQGKAGGTMQIADTNAGKGVIADGRYQYTVQQTDLAGNTLGAGSPITVFILATPPVAPKPFLLDPAFDTGTFPNDGITKDNNGKYPAPVFDANGVIPRATVELFRQAVVGGVPSGPSVLVNTLTDVTPTGGGLLQIPDTNAGKGAIADGTYLYTAEQIDLAGNPSPISTGYLVTIDTDGPQADPPAAPVLEGGSDTGTFINDQVTNKNNSPSPANAPVFDAGAGGNPVEAGATVELFRALVNPATGIAGTPVLVNTLTNTAGGVVPIADVNAPSNTPIPDGTYVYTVQLIDLAGVTGSVSAGLKVTILATAPPLPQPFRLDPASDTGVSNSDGITQITLFHAPVFDAGLVEKGATLNLYRVALDGNGNPIGSPALVNSLVNVPAGGSLTINDPSSLSDGKYVYTIQQIDLAGNPSPIGGAITVTYDTAQPPITPAPTLDPASDTGVSGDNLTSNTSPFFDVNVAVSGFEVNSSLSLVRDGNVVASTPYNVATGLVKIQDPGPVPFGVHTYKVFLTDQAGNIGVFSAPVTITFANDPPGTIKLDPASDSGVKGDNITNVTSPTFDVSGVVPNGTLLLLRGGITVATVFTGPGGIVTINDKGPLTNGSYTYTAQQRDSTGKVSPAGPPLTITIEVNSPVAPSPFVLDPASDSGFKGDGITNVTNPTFDASGILPGATVKLFAAKLNTTTGVFGAPVLVASVTATSTGSVKVTDPGPEPSGVYSYTVQQVDVAGNVSPNSSPQAVTIDATVPATPGLVLDPASHQGSSDPNTTNVVSPFFDASNVLKGATLRLYRRGLSQPITTLTNVAGGTVMIQDVGPLINGSYTYTVVQTNVAGTDSLVSAPLTIKIDTTPPLNPTIPTLSLDPSTDSGVKGDGVTNSRHLLINGTADPGVVINLLDGTGNSIAVTAADGTGKFQISLPTSMTNGVYTFSATATDSRNHVSAPTNPPLKVRVVTVEGDYSGAGKTSVELFRRTTPSLIQWFVNGYHPLANDPFGAGAFDVPLTGDFFGTGQIDPAVYRPGTAQWFVQNPSNGYTGQLLVTFGWPNHDLPVPGNYYGNYVDVPGVFRPTTGEFFVLGSPTATVVVAPKSGDFPVPGNYDNTGKDEFAVFRPSASTWYIMGPNGVVHTVMFGGPNDIPAPGAYDATTTSQATEPGVWRPSTGQFFVLGPNGGRGYQFQAGDVPAPGDYDGIGVTEPAVYRPSTHQFLVYGPNDDPTRGPRVFATYGGPSLADVPAVAPYPYRSLKGGGGVTAMAAAGGLDFGARALGLTAPAGSVAAAPVSGAVAVKPSSSNPPVVSVVPGSARLRPNQPSGPSARGGSQPVDLVDHALTSLTYKKHRPWGHFGHH